MFYLILETDIVEESENEDINYLARTNLVAGGARARGGKTYCVGETVILLTILLL
jgi:hypothetical protein